jgi:hypothetical protein
MPLRSFEEFIMRRTLTVIFDGKVLIPEKPVKLPVGEPLSVQIQLVKHHTGKKPAKSGKIIGMGQFLSGIPDLASNKKHLEGFGQ